MYTGGQRLHTLGTAAPGQLDSPAASLLRICTIRSSHPRVATLGCTHGPSPSPTAQQHQGLHGPHTAMILWSDLGFALGAAPGLSVEGIAEACSCEPLLGVVQSVYLSGVESGGKGSGIWASTARLRNQVRTSLCFLWKHSWKTLVYTNVISKTLRVHLSCAISHRNLSRMFACSSRMHQNLVLLSCVTAGRVLYLILEFSGSFPVAGSASASTASPSLSW